MPRVAVIGAGVIGLSTAVRLQTVLPGCNVTIIADSFGADTTSVGAAGLFRPTLDLVPGVEPHVIRRWVKSSWDHYEKLAKSDDSPEAGVYFLSGYHMYDDGEGYVVKPNLVEEVTYNFRQMLDSEHSLFNNRRRQNGVFFTSIMIEGRWYLQWLQKRFEQKGGQIIKRTIKHLKELIGHYDVVVNCTGLRAKELCDDKLVIANRGQVIRLNAPWIKHFVYVDNDTWIIPGIDTVTVGGTRQHNDDYDKLRPEETRAILERVYDAIPSLKKAEILRQWPGLRPYRRPPKIERQKIKDNSGNNLEVVHHYGHGGNGMGLSWGTSCEAVDLIVEALSEKRTLSRL